MELNFLSNELFYSEDVIKEIACDLCIQQKPAISAKKI